jgi:hypothetical protein
MLVRFTRTAAAVAVALLVLAAPVYAAAVAPKSGATYKGETSQGEKVTLVISGKSVQILAFDFQCGKKSRASTSVQDLKITLTDGRYRFDTSTNGIVSYADEQPDENGKIDARGRFSKSAKTVSGLLRVQTKRCHSTGYIKFSASR